MLSIIASYLLVFVGDGRFYPKFDIGIIIGIESVGAWRYESWNSGSSFMSAPFVLHSLIYKSAGNIPRSLFRFSSLEDAIFGPSVFKKAILEKSFDIQKTHLSNTRKQKRVWRLSFGILRLQKSISGARGAENELCKCLYAINHKKENNVAKAMCRKRKCLKRRSYIMVAGSQRYRTLCRNVVTKSTI